MPKPTTNSQLKNWIGNNNHLLESARGWKQIDKIFRDNGLVVTAREYYDLLYPEKIIDCDRAKFVSLSVGYRTCYKGCNCYRERVSAAVQNAKAEYSDEKRDSIRAKREQTVSERYGVSNVFQLTSTVEKSSNTKTARYGDSNYNNRDKAAATLFEKSNVTNPMQLPEVKAKVVNSKDHTAIAAKTKQTKLERYGAPSYNNPARRRETCISRYDVDNPAKDSTVKGKISQRLREKFIERHRVTYNIVPGFTVSAYAPGKKNIWYCASCGRKISGVVDSGKFSRCLTCNPLSVSKPELALREFVMSLGFEVITNSRDIIPPLEIDIAIPSKKIAIEFCGTYWHSEQKGKGKYYHRDKLLRCRDVGYKLITVFSDTWESKPELVKSRIMSAVGVLPNKLNARDCLIRPVSYQTAQHFFAATHTQGPTRAAVRLGLFYKEELVALMSFGKSRFEKNTQELIRFSTLPGHNIRGAASKLFSRYVADYCPTRIVSYSDNNWGLTTFYHKLGFELESIGTPGYSYIDLRAGRGIRMNRINFQKHKLSEKFESVDLTKTEYEIMLDNHHDRVWDTGHSRWVWYQKT